MRILVLLGGVSNEREVSLRSGKAVEEALKRSGHEVLEYDPAEGYEGLAKYVGQVDFVFPILHGQGGEDGELQTELERLGFKYLGSDSAVCKLCFDKNAFKEKIQAFNVPTPAWEVVTEETFQNSPLRQKPYVLKPIEGGSTIDCFIIRNLASDSPDLKIFDKHQEMLLEELIEGTEITIPVLDKKALPVIEIIPPEGKEFDYENKYNGASQEICPPKNVATEKQQEAQKIAETVHNKLGVRHLSRTDIMIDKVGKLWVLELNTIPGLTDQSLFPKSAKMAGIPMEDLVQKFLDLTLSQS
jgi:D-alanine-D-alanine ligase